MAASSRSIRDPGAGLAKELAALSSTTDLANRYAKLVAENQKLRVRNDEEFYRGVLSALSVLQPARSPAVRQYFKLIVATIGRDDLLRVARIHGTEEWSGLIRRRKGRKHVEKGPPRNRAVRGAARRRRVPKPDVAP